MSWSRVGGQGGRGNARFATPTRQTPRFAETGLPGDELDLELRLKLVVDAALAGFPNAGKSSLLRRISNAKPKVADYPFTTLEPVLGVVDGPDDRQLTVADVPGLIEGAADGAGLGHQFLAHLERARLLVHVLDASEPDLEERFRTIDRELAEYGAGLDARPQLVVLNKIDLLERVPAFELADDRVVRVVATSCATGAGIDELKLALFELCPDEAPVDTDDGSLPEFLDYTPRARRGPRFRILRTDRGYRVVGTPPPAEELEDALRGLGIKRGDPGRGRRRGARVAVGDPRRRVRPASRRSSRAGTRGRRGAAARRASSSSSIAEPGHKDAVTPAETRLELARLAFADVPEAVVELDRHARTVDSLEERRLPTDTFFVLGADELADFESWKEPQRVLELARLAVAMRPGVPRDEVDAVRRRLDAGDRIVEFELEPVPISSSGIRARVARGEPIDDLVPPRSRRRSGASGCTQTPE